MSDSISMNIWFVWYHMLVFVSDLKAV